MPARRLIEVLCFVAQEATGSSFIVSAGTFVARMRPLQGHLIWTVPEKAAAHAIFNHYVPDPSIRLETEESRFPGKNTLVNWEVMAYLIKFVGAEQHRQFLINFRGSKPKAPRRGERNLTAADILHAASGEETLQRHPLDPNQKKRSSGMSPFAANSATDVNAALSPSSGTPGDPLLSGQSSLPEATVLSSNGTLVSEQNLTLVVASNSSVSDGVTLPKGPRTSFVPSHATPQQNGPLPTSETDLSLGKMDISGRQ